MGKSVLIADDSRSARESMKEVLRMTDVEIQNIYEAADGEEVIKIVEKHSVDILMLDFDMPRKNGLTVLRELKALPGSKPPQVAVISGMLVPRLKDELKEAGAAVVLEKPFEIYDVVQLVSAEMI